MGVDPAKPAYRNASKPYVREQIEFIRKNGYGWGVDVVMEGVGGLAVAAPNPDGVSYLAVSISAIKSRVTGDRVAQVAARVAASAEARRAVASDREQPGGTAREM